MSTLKRGHRTLAFPHSWAQGAPIWECDAAIGASRFAGGLDDSHRTQSKTGGRSVFSPAKNHVHEILCRGEERVNIRLGQVWVASELAVKGVKFHLTLPEFHQEKALGSVNADLVISFGIR